MEIEAKGRDQKPIEASIELSRLLELGSLLASVLSPAEVENLRICLVDYHDDGNSADVCQLKLGIGNNSVT